MYDFSSVSNVDLNLVCSVLFETGVQYTISNQFAEYNFKPVCIGQFQAGLQCTRSNRFGLSMKSFSHALGLHFLGLGWERGRGRGGGD